MKHKDGNGTEKEYVLISGQGKCPLIINQGETWRRTFTWMLGDETRPESWEPIRLYGYVGRCQVRRGIRHPGIVATIPVDIFDPGKGRFALSLTAEETASIPTTGDHYHEMELYDYDVEFVSSAGTVYRVLKGTIHVSPEVTR